METVTSADGTSIAYERHGSGPPLVLLHGGSADRESWDAVVPALAEDYEVLVPDRRGRGASGDADEYDLDREVADLRALADAVDGDPAVFGHSFGGLVALAAAADGLVHDGLILYEPALLVGEHRGDDLADRMADRLADGERLAAMRLFVEEAGGVPDADQLPWWPEEVNVDLAETVVRENYAVEEYRLPEEPDLGSPVVLLTGERSSDHLRDAVSELRDRLPESDRVEFDGVGHVGIQTAPERVAETVRAFLPAE